MRCLVIALLPALALAGISFEQHCEDLSKVSLGNNVIVQFAEYLSAEAAVDQEADGFNATCIYWSAPPVPVSLCRVGLKITTSKSSSTLMEAWLPEEWEGRYLQVGNYGFGGCIDYPQLAYGTSLGFATVGTNNGHNGSSAGAFNHQPEVLTDFSWRALYSGAVVGKSITKKFYGKGFKSYHLGCSTGGRQGWRAAQSHPELFDGIVAGCPVINNNALLMYFGQLMQGFLGPGTGVNLTNSDWKLIADEVAKQCDELDGAKDNLVEDTRRCKPNLTKLTCNPSQTENCLSKSQFSTIEKIFSPFKYGNMLLHPGTAHGDELRFIKGLYDGIPITLLNDWARFVYPGNLSWQLSDYTSQLLYRTVKANAGDVNTFNPDISAFRNRGGKMLHWHGQSDPYISSFNSDWYYNNTLKATAGGNVAELDKFYRYFRVSGTEHCWGGPGANMIGQDSKVGSKKPEDNVLMAVVQWVEKGIAPKTIRGVKFEDDDPTKAVEFTRKHCKYPLTNKYKDKGGDGKDESKWECVQE